MRSRDGVSARARRVKSQLTTLRTANAAATTLHSPRPIQSAMLGTFVLLSMRVTQQELLEARDHARPVDGLHRRAGTPAHRRQRLWCLRQPRRCGDETTCVAR